MADELPSLKVNPQKKSKLITFRIDTETYLSFLKRLKEENATKSKTLRSLIQEYVEESVKPGAEDAGRD